jgi:hypothetical protein
MKRTIFGAAAFAVFALIVVSGAAAAGSGVTSNGFETDTAGWFDNDGTINREASGYVNPGGYASPTTAATGGYFAALNRGPCSVEVGGGGNTIRCSGPYTDWGGYGSKWNGTYTTQVDIYLDAAYANDPANEDSYGGNLDLATGSNSTDPSYKGTRFDYTSAINDNTGAHLRDFGFVVGTGQSGTTCTGWTVNAQQNVNRINAFPDDLSKNPACIADSGWYTFKHTFFENADHNLEVLMQIIRKSDNAVVAHWNIVSGPAGTPDPISTVGCNRYGWFSNQEIWGLPIDNARIEGGCVAPVITGGQILPTGTTCQAYHAGATSLDKVQYTLTKGGKINSVSPGVFFYYGTVTGTAGQTVTITQTANPATAPLIPIQHGQVILYDTSCNVVKWTHNDSAGVATGTLPSTGTFIISVKYSPADLKGVSNPGTVTYTIDGATIVLQPK